MVAAGIIDLQKRFGGGTDHKPAHQVETEFGLVQFLGRAVPFGIEHLLIVVQRDSRLPESHLWRSDEGGIDAILMVEVDRLKYTNLFLLVIYSTYVGKEIVFAREAADESQPRISQVQVDALSYRRTQQRIAALIEHTTVIDDHRSQHIVGRAGDALTVAQLGAPLLLLPCHRQVGEPVIIGSAGLGLPGVERVVVSRNMLIAQAGIQAPRPYLHLVFSKAGNVLFLHLVIRFRDDVLLVDILALALGGSNFRSTTQHALPDGIGQHQLACRHPTVLPIDRSDGAVAQFLTELPLVEMILRCTSQHSCIQVNAQFPDLSHIVRIQFPDGFVKLIDICFQTNISVIGTVLLVVLRHIRLEAVVKQLL